MIEFLDKNSPNENSRQPGTPQILKIPRGKFERNRGKELSRIIAVFVKLINTLNNWPKYIKPVLMKGSFLGLKI